jgi:hypothetical protein
MLMEGNIAEGAKFICIMVACSVVAAEGAKSHSYQQE